MQLLKKKTWSNKRVLLWDWTGVNGVLWSPGQTKLSLWPTFWSLTINWENLVQGAAEAQWVWDLTSSKKVAGQIQLIINRRSTRQRGTLSLTPVISSCEELMSRQLTKELIWDTLTRVWITPCKWVTVWILLVFYNNHSVFLQSGHH